MKTGLTNDTPLNRLLARTPKTLQAARTNEGVYIMIKIPDKTVAGEVYRLLNHALFEGELIIEINRGE